ncbi:nitrous oxide reductase family maturation protein NosD [Phaeodactylibacter xiamenensis]|jgi:nitrous oxidase accessory protein|uniref:nitrous oxide reductase family maturation protein NosD n=1 Tax=Phaeodactylibacter xiamenensis TaxID=1524460 RepID=UPI0024A814DB|nr:nitrous oxide reductase family maturation protein NosD [Phaeodactylibacter xiamenensis]
MRAILQYFSLLATTLLLATTAAAQPQTLRVGPEEDYPSIEAALSAADSGDVVEIHAGTYYEHGLVVDKPLHIRGIGYPVLDAQEQGEILTIIAHDVTVEGLQLQNVGVSYLKDHAGIRVRQRSRAIIRNNRLVNTFFGIYLERVHEAVIENNELSGVLRDEASSGNGIHAWHCEKLDIRDNWVTGHRDGIYFEFVDSSKIVGNESVGNQRYGLHFMFSNHDEYHHNRFADNGAGVAVMFSKFIDMWENTFENNWGRAAYGLLLKEIYDARIEDNHFIQNTIGINIEGSTRIVYQRNAFRRNGWAIKMAGGCLDNDITANNFQSNTLDLVVNSNVNNNTFTGNYWSEYNGYDLDRDGIGDVPYRPVKLFSYILDQTPEAIVLLRSFFVSLMNFSEKVSPVFTPANVLDHQPSMQPLSL